MGDPPIADGVWIQIAALGVFSMFARQVIQDILGVQARKKNGKPREVIPITREDTGDLEKYVCKATPNPCGYRDDRDDIRDLLRAIEVNTRRQ